MISYPHLMDHHHDPALVLLSVAVSFLGAFTGLSMGARSHHSTGRIRAAYIACSSMALGGCAIWAMHFIGMLALQVHGGVIHYDPWLTFLSLMLAIAFTGAGIAIVALYGTRPISLSIAGVAMGLGVASMHYTGMAAMRMNADIMYDRPLVGLSIAIAVTAATAALWLVFNLRTLHIRLYGAAAMAVAVAGMHYTAMAATTFIGRPGQAPDMATGLPALTMAAAVTIATLVVVLMGLLTTYIARAEAAHRQMQDDLRRLELEQTAEARKCETVATLAGGIAHEFNNLLAVVIGNLDLLESQFPERGEVQEQLQGALAASLRGAELTHHLLAFGRNQPLFEEQTDLNALIASTGDELARSTPPGVSVELELSQEVLLVNIDPAQFRKALESLVTNSVEAMPSGGRILIRTEAGHGPPAANGEPRKHASVWVSDTGCGIAVENLNRVIEPFFSTKPGASRGGLGLSMVYGFVKQCGGHLDVLSKVGHGTTLRISFPLVVEAKPASSNPAQASISDYSTKLILVVDDDAAVRSTVVAQLLSLGYRTAQAVDGPDALRQVDGNPNIDVVLTDLMMPGMNGFELGRELSARSPALQVLYTSGFTREAVAGYDVPPERFLAKPYRRKDLAQKLQQLLMAA